MMRAGMRDLVGQIVGAKYRLTRRIGGGGVSEVYEAVHEEFGQHFAIKVLKREYAEYPDVVRRFFLEARAASAAGHPGIVQVFDIGWLDDKTPYLVMELLRGESLADVLRRDKKLSQDRAVNICMHILEALEAAHRAGVIHRDLKPENVLLVRGPGGEPWAKLIDFGIARLVHDGPVSLRQTLQGTVMGTPYYMSPEQVRASADIDARSDIYAVGVMLFEMITGKVPFRGYSPEEVMSKVLSEPFPSVRELEPSVPQALEDVIRRATQRKRDARYATALEFSEALRPLRAEMVAVRVLPEEELPPQAADAPLAASSGEPTARAPALGVPFAGSTGERGPMPSRDSARPPRRQPPPPPLRRSPVPSDWPPEDLASTTVPYGAGPDRSRPVVVESLPPSPPSQAPGGSDAGLVASPGDHPSAMPDSVPTAPSRPSAEQTLPIEPRLPSPVEGGRSGPRVPSESIPPGYAALIVPRRTLFLLLVLGAVVVAASVIAVLLALLRPDDADRLPPGVVAEVAGAQVAVGPRPSIPGAGNGKPSPHSQADATVQQQPDVGTAAADAGAVGEPVEVEAAFDTATADPSGDAKDASDETPPRVTVRVVGIPRGGQATVDEVAVGAEFELPLDGVERQLRVVAPGYRTFETRFVPAEGLVLRIRMERHRRVASGGPAPTPERDPPSASRPDARVPLADPFDIR